jgi:ABC-2 type transport system ATP-binding protein
VSESLAAVNQAGLTVADMSTEEADLEDIFLQLTRGAHSAPATQRGSATRSHAG